MEGFQNSSTEQGLGFLIATRVCKKIRLSGDAARQRSLLMEGGHKLHQDLLLREYGQSKCLRIINVFRRLWEDVISLYHDNHRGAPLYRQLEEHEIRLLSITKNDAHALSYSLDSYPLWLAPEFDAVSYCWGECTDTTTITCNGKKLPIRLSLLKILDHLANGAAYPLRPLWIDAISLNQQDDAEKAHQVPRMGQVYRLAKRALIWLGEGTDDSDKALAFIEALHAEVEKNGYCESVKEAVEILHTEVGRPMLERILALMRSPWFTRIWTLQEAILASDCTMVCGSVSVQWAAFGNLFDTMKFFHLTHLLIAKLEEDLTTMPTSGQGPDLLKIMRNTMQEHHYILPFRLFHACETRTSQEPIDRIWGVLALFPEDLQLRIKNANIVDYSVSGRSNYWKSYLEFMKLLCQYSPAQLWSVIAITQGLEKNSNLPSWCPDLSRKRLTEDFERIGKYAAGVQDRSIPIATKLALQEGSALLKVPGFIFDTVREVTEINSIPEGPVVDFFQDGMPAWLEQCYALVEKALGTSELAAAKLCQTLKSYPPGRDFRPLTAAEQLEKELREAVIAYEAWNHVGSTLPSNHDVRVWCQRSVRLTGRRFFNTAERRIGLGPADMRSGDSICIFNGASAVYILRKLDLNIALGQPVHTREQLEKHAEIFSLVGDAYVNGHMQGEAFTASGRGPEREFVLA